MKGYSRSKEDFREILYTKYFTMEEIVYENGALGVGEQVTDYLLAEGFEDNLPKLVKQDDVIYEYNQYKQQWSKKSCTIFSAIGAVSDLFNYKFSIDEIKTIDNMSYARGRMKDSGWYTQSAVKLVADYWNEHHKDLWEVAYYRIEKSNNDVIKNILEKGYTMMTTFSWNYNYIKDYDADWVLNWTSFWTPTFWHAINVRRVNGKRCCKDSAAGSEHNVYELEHTLKEITCYYENAYIYTKVKEDKLEDVKRLNEFRTLLLATIEANSKLRHLTNDENYKNKLHEMNNLNREKLKHIDAELARYS